MLVQQLFWRGPFQFEQGVDRLGTESATTARVCTAHPDDGVGKYPGNPSDSGGLDQGLTHPARDAKLLILGWSSISWSVPQSVLVDFWDLVGPVQLGKSRGCYQVPYVPWEGGMATEGGKNSRRDDGWEGAHGGDNGEEKGLKFKFGGGKKNLIQRHVKRSKTGST